MENKNKKFILILSCSLTTLFALSLAMFYLFTAKKDTIYIFPDKITNTNKNTIDCLNLSEWKNFSNNEYGFSLSFPPNFNTSTTDPLNLNVTDLGIEKGDDSSISRFCYTNNQTTDNLALCNKKETTLGLKKEYSFYTGNNSKDICLPPFSFSFTMKIYQNNKKVSLKNWIEKRFFAPLVCEPIVVNGVDGLRCINQENFANTNQDAILKDYFLANGDLIFHFQPFDVFPSLPPDVSSIDALNQNAIYNQIISTFKIPGK